MTEEISFQTQSGDELPALLTHPAEADTLFVLGHGSGSTIHVPLMGLLSDALSSLRIASLRFEYPYSSKPDFVPFSDMPVDEDPILIETVRAALKIGLQCCPRLKMVIGGHSMSGLMATYADAANTLQVDGIISLAYPRKGDPSKSRHLSDTVAPLLFIQGTDDALGTRAEIEEMTHQLGDRAVLHWIEGATHGFSVEGRKLSQVASEIAKTVRKFVDDIC